MNIDIMEKSKTNIKDEIKVNSTIDVVNLKEVEEIRKAFREHLLFISLDNKNNIRNISVLGIGSTCSAVTEKDFINMVGIKKIDRRYENKEFDNYVLKNREMAFAY